ncbi:hypothetical protein LTR15_011815 [Elasticomyces elasticus]|nr:hypothetical protein LTR15_011815 [Elasticomyces elasticus]
MATPLPPHLAHYDAASSRLSIPYPLRLPLALTLAALSGSVLGLSQGGLEAGLRFQAENTHRQPTTKTGWYLYHKSKNYHTALGGVKEAFKMAGKLALWVVRMARSFRTTVAEDDKLVEGSRDFLSTTLAGLGTAGLFSAWNRFPAATAVRTMKMGAKVGLLFGVAEDAVGLMRGRRVGYVDFVKRRLFGVAERGSSAGLVAAAG